jgi:hypothetical protein
MLAFAAGTVKIVVDQALEYEMLGHQGIYNVGRFCLSVIELIAMIAIGLGVLAAIVGVTTGAGFGFVADAGPGLTSATPGIGLAVVGFFLMAWTQVSRARFDTAEMTKELLAGLGREASA